MIIYAWLQYDRSTDLLPQVYLYGRSKSLWFIIHSWQNIASVTCANYCPDYYPRYIYMVEHSERYRHYLLSRLLSQVYLYDRKQLVLQGLIVVQAITPGISIWQKVASIAVDSITGANYCPDAYLFMLVVRRLLLIMLTQRSNCIGRLRRNIVLANNFNR